MASKNVSAADEARRQYYREWRKKNPDKVRAAMQRYWEKKAQAQQESAVEGENE